MLRTLELQHSLCLTCEKILSSLPICRFYTFHGSILLDISYLIMHITTSVSGGYRPSAARGAGQVARNVRFCYQQRRGRDRWRAPARRAASWWLGPGSSPPPSRPAHPQRLETPEAYFLTMSSLIRCIFRNFSETFMSCKMVPSTCTTSCMKLFPNRRVLLRTIHSHRSCLSCLERE